MFAKISGNVSKESIYLLRMRCGFTIKKGAPLSPKYNGKKRRKIKNSVLTIL
jgi:hypothetical protein